MFLELSHHETIHAMGVSKRTTRALESRKNSMSICRGSGVINSYQFSIQEELERILPRKNEAGYGCCSLHLYSEKLQNNVYIYMYWTSTKYNI